MNAAQRRQMILERLTQTRLPVSAGVLAKELGVSRQIVVGDVALLRAGGAQIDATPRGYQLRGAAEGYTGILACAHSTVEQMRQELYTVVDNGGVVVDVSVDNALYGELRATPEPDQPLRCGGFYYPGRGKPRLSPEPDDRRGASAYPALPGAGDIPPH